MSKLVIFGATGQQGRSILDTVHNDPNLSKQYSIRAITRDTSQSAAKEIAKQGIETIQADASDPASLPAALENAHTVIIITTTTYDADLKAREYSQVKAVGDAAVAAGAKYLIFSTAVHSAALWNGRAVDAFDSKAEAEEYLRSLPLKTAFFAPSMFMQNLTTMMAPVPGPDGTYTIASVISPDTQIPLIDVAHDSGKYIAAILADPENTAGITLHAATGLYSFAEIAAIISRVSGKTVNYVKIPEEVYAGFMKPEQGARVASMMRFFEEVGYFGPNTPKLVDRTVKMVKAKLTTFEEFAGKYLVNIQ
ncbi:NmrA-like domain-containing protein 1 [Aspergillus alliaceus]|uniref:NmrA-like domain-containing protein 1 n=1 Tax=Petromyces alliaceus TaxID=209559 RepID=A0A8H6E3B4_PETAA|nr:NmrA-like domain-containing protein 1 [Aspergillus burnettii]